MSFLHSHSCESVKSELDLFGLPVTQTSIERSEWVYYEPVAALNDSAPIEFVVSGHGEDYIDLAQTLIIVNAKITNEDGTNLAEDAVVGPVNNWLHSLFSQVDVFPNGKLISSPSQTYAYRAYIETQLNYDTPAKCSQLTTRLYYKDLAGKMDGFTANTTGMSKRMALTKSSATVELMGNIHHDLFNQDRFLLNGVEMRVKFIKTKDAFNLMSKDGAAMKSKITDAQLLVRKVRVNSSVLLAHNRTLEKSHAKYPLTRVDLKTVTIPAGLQSKTLDNIFMGQLPKRVIIGFVSNSSLNGDFKKNPFNFQHFNCNHVALYADGQHYPSKPLQPNFETNQYMTAYHTLYSGTGIHFQDEGNGITREEYPQGYCLMAFDLTPDLSASVDHWCVQRNGSLRVEVKFKTSLSEAVDCIIYAEFDNLLEKDQHRNVIVDYNN
jgi:hypothetical protein